jgi:starvation-inducible outer membrane lipoprotein
MGRARPLLLLLIALALAACSASPREVYERALAAREAKDLPAFLQCFSARTRKLLGNLSAVEEATRKKLAYLKDPLRLLPEAAPTGEAREDGNLATLKVGSGRAEVEVVLVREGGEWKIEALELESFWAPMEPVTQ